MNPEGWPTPEQVAARIAEVAALNRLCASLAEAGEVMRPAAVCAAIDCGAAPRGGTSKKTADTERGE